MNYQPIPTFGREKVPAPSRDGRSTIMRPTGRTVQVAGRPMPGTAPAPVAPPTSTPPMADSSADYDSSAIGFQHYHDALANASGGLDPSTGTYMSGHFKGMNQQQAMHYAQKGWLQLGPQGQAGMVKKLAPLYGTRNANMPATTPGTTATPPSTGTATPPTTTPAAPATRPGQIIGINSKYGTASNAAIPRPQQRASAFSLKPRVADDNGAVDLVASRAAGTIKNQPKEPEGLLAEIPRPIMGGAWK